MKTSTTRQRLLRARRNLGLLGLAGVVGLEAFAYVDLYHRTSFEMPVFLMVLGLFVVFGALVSNALRCPTCTVELGRYYKGGVGRDLHFCPNCHADFNAPPPGRFRAAA